MLVSFNWLQEYIGDAIPSVEKITELLTFHSFEIEDVQQVGDDWVIDVDVLPNRSSDCLSHRGIAREIATLLDTALVYDPLQKEIDLPATDAITVAIENTDACQRFTATLIEGLAVTQSPAWLQERLKAIGQRPINNIVDATNYVMFSIGQPMHAYDADKFPSTDGVWQFSVRTAKEGETIRLLGEGKSDEAREFELQGTETLVVDKSTGTPISLAGIKGGSFAEVTVDTKRIILESAHWDPVLTRTTARRLGFVIESSKRNENEPSAELLPFSQQDAVKLIKKIAGGNCTGYVDVYPIASTQPTSSVSVAKANALLGISLSGKEMESILKRAGISVTNNGETLECTGPFERTDLNIQEDFIEEIGRLYGYSHVASILPETVPLVEINARHYYSEKVREALVGVGFSEVITSSFRKKDEVQLQNALASDKSYMRSSLTKNIEEVLDKNAGLTDLLGAEDTRVFEIGTVFYKSKIGIGEHTSLCLGIRLKQSGYTGKEDKRVAEVLSLLESALDCKLDFAVLKGVAEINFSKVIKGLPVPSAYKPASISEEIVYKPFSIYPSMSRDIALWVKKGTSVEAVETVLNDYAGSLRVRTTLFDEFTKEGRTSFAFRLVFQSQEKTLTDDEVNIIMDEVYKAVIEKGWEVR